MYGTLNVATLKISTHLIKIRDRASSIVNHIESTIERQSTTVFPVYFAGGSQSHLGDSS